MRCVLVFYFVATIFAIVHGMSELCQIREYGGTVAYCGKYYVKHIFDFIPPVSQIIKYMDLNGQPLKQLPYNAYRNVTSQSSLSAISVRYCNISHVDAGALVNLHSLTAIDLSYNDITQLDINLFSHTKQLEQIFMGYNKIEVLPRGLFENLTLLDRVDLHHNRIRQVERYSFKNAPALRIIDLGNNRIEFLDMLFKDKIERLEYLWLYDNPWKCDCDLGPLYEFLVKIDRLDQPALECEKPPALHGRNWSDTNRDEFVCPSEDATSTLDTVTTSTEVLITNGVILELAKDQVNTEDKTSTSLEKPKTESSDKPVGKGEPESRTEISNITQRSLIIDEEKVVAVDDGTNSNEDSIKMPQEPVDDQIVTTTTEISFNKHKETDTDVQTHFNDLKWLPWTLFSVAIVCLVGCAARYTFIRHRRRTMPSVKRADQLAEDASELMCSQTAQQANC